MNDLFLDFLGSFYGKIAIAFIATIAYTVIIARFVKILKGHPISFTVAILGFPASGKSVYVTTLFDLLQQGKSKVLRASPYGADTIEEVSRNLNILGKGEWLPRTPSGNPFFFRAIASMAGMSRVRLEIADFAGENFEGLLPESDRWLHRGEYFKYVVDANAIFLALDGERLMFDHDDGRVEEIINSFVASIQVVADSRGAVGSVKLDIPVALLVMKADLMEKEDIALARDHLSRLEAICRARCNNFEVFFVSSTGSLVDGRPSARRLPSQVIEPLEWALNRSMNVSPLLVVRKFFLSADKSDDRWDRRN